MQKNRSTQNLNYGFSSQNQQQTEKVKFPSQRIYNDKMYAILYFVSLVGFVIIASLGFSQAFIAFKQENPIKEDPNSIPSIKIFYLVMTAAISGFLASIGYFYLIKRYAGTLIKIQAVSYVVLLFVYTAYLILVKAYFGAVFAFIFAIIIAVCLFVSRITKNHSPIKEEQYVYKNNIHTCRHVFVFVLNNHPINGNSNNYRKYHLKQKRKNSVVNCCRIF